MNHKEYIINSKQIAKKLNNHLEQFCNENPIFKSISAEYTKKRIHLNGTQFYAGFKSANTTTNFDFFLNIPIVIECIMLMAYKTNKIIDHKQEVWNSKQKIKETVLSEGVYLSLILELLEDSKNNLGKKYNLVRDIILDLISKINQGFWFEQTCLNINFSPLEIILKNWAEKYKKRNMLFDKIYDYAPLLGYYIASGDKTIFTKYENYFENKKESRLSHSGQIINDLSDYTSIYDENVKSYQDAFSDIRNGIITQPTFEIIKEKLILDALKNPQLTKDLNWRKKIIKILVKNKVVEKIKKITTKSYTENINFWEKIININSHNKLLPFTYSFLLKNKYYLYYLELEN